MIEAQNALSTAGPAALALYEKLLVAVRKIGKFEIEVKKTSIHLTRKTAFAGVQLRKQHLIVTIKSAEPLSGARVLRAEQTSKNRWHVEVMVADAAELDAETVDWLRTAYELAA